MINPLEDATAAHQQGNVVAEWTGGETSRLAAHTDGLGRRHHGGGESNWGGHHPTGSAAYRQLAEQSLPILPAATEATPATINASSSAAGLLR